MSVSIQGFEAVRNGSGDGSCTTCDGSGMVKCWDPGGPCPDRDAGCECCGPCLEHQERGSGR